MLQSILLPPMYVFVCSRVNYLVFGDQGSTWNPGKGDAVEILALGMAAAQGFPPVDQWQHQDKKEAEHFLYPQEIGSYLERFFLLLLDMYGKVG